MIFSLANALRRIDPEFDFGFDGPGRGGPLSSQLIDVTNGQVGLGSDQVNRVAGKKSHFKRVRNGSGQSGYRLGRVGLTCIFHIKFFLFKKTICVCHLESYATNYLM